MFNEIEKEYRKGLQERRFAKYYWPRAVVVAVLGVLARFIFGLNDWIVCGAIIIVLIILVILFFMHDLHAADQTFARVNEQRRLLKKLKAYFKADDTKRISNLVTDLAQHDISTKADLELAFEYYKSRLPNNSRPNFLEWFLTTVVTLASIFLVTYDDDLGNINLHKLGLALYIALIVLTPIILAKIIKLGIANSRNRAETILVEDLAYIIVHYDRYREKLNS